MNWKFVLAEVISSDVSQKLIMITLQNIYMRVDSRLHPKRAGTEKKVCNRYVYIPSTNPKEKRYCPKYVPKLTASTPFATTAQTTK